jgi:hypothetical protein
MTGESTSVVRDAGAKWISLAALAIAIGSGVPNFQFVGKLQARGVVDVVRLVAFGIKQDLIPADDRELVGGGRAGGESAFESGGRKKVEFGVTSVTPAGTSTWMVKPSSSIAAPLQSFAAGFENLRPARSMTGPSGACSPGIHFG